MIRINSLVGATAAPTASIEEVNALADICLALEHASVSTEAYALLFGEVTISTEGFADKAKDIAKKTYEAIKAFIKKIIDFLTGKDKKYEKAENTLHLILKDKNPKLSREMTVDQSNISTEIKAYVKKTNGIEGLRESIDASKYKAIDVSATISLAIAEYHYLLMGGESNILKEGISGMSTSLLLKHFGQTGGTEASFLEAIVKLDFFKDVESLAEFKMKFNEFLLVHSSKIDPKDVELNLFGSIDFFYKEAKELLNNIEANKDNVSDLSKINDNIAIVDAGQDVIRNLALDAFWRYTKVRIHKMDLRIAYMEAVYNYRSKLA